MKYEVRAMSFGEILDTGFRLLTNHFVLFTSIAAIVFVPLSLVGSMMTPNANASRFVIAGIVWLMTIVLSPLVTGAITYAIGEVYLGREVTIGIALRTGLALMMQLVGTGLLASLAIMGGFLLLIIPGFYVTLWFMLTTQVVVFERLSGPRALRRSRELMRGNLGRGSGILLLVSILTMILTAGFQLALRIVPMLAPFGSALAQTVAMAYSSTVTVLLYFDIRSRKEAFDLEHLVSVVESDVSRAAFPSPAI